MMDAFDILLVDLQDVGCRIYTFVTTLRYVLEAAAGKTFCALALRRETARTPAGARLMRLTRVLHGPKNKWRSTARAERVTALGAPHRDMAVSFGTVKNGGVTADFGVVYVSRDSTRRGACEC
jgi:hypothetical protein